MSFEWLSHSAALAAAAHVCVTLIVAGRAVMRRSTSNTVVLWLLFVAAAPLLGVLVYFIVAERRLEAMDRNALREEGFRKAQHEDGFPAADPDDGLGRIAARFPSVESSHGNSFGFHTGPDAIFPRLIADIGAAQRELYLETYIWCAGGRMDEVAAALREALARGVSCTVIVDAIGSGAWCRGEEIGQLRMAGVTVIEALPLRRWRTVFARSDMRLHRKILAIDDRIAWTGSMNMADPTVFKHGDPAAPWVDALVRIEGPAAAHLAGIVRKDVAQETGTAAPPPQATPPGSGGTHLHVVRSGPDDRMDELLHMTLAIVNSAHRQLILATPYLVPDDAILQALRGAAYRGVRIEIVVPERIDTLLVRHASHSHYDGLLNIGARIHRYGKGLLHVKALVADDTLSMFGSANLDLRSLWLNDEVSLFSSDPSFGIALALMLRGYIDDAAELHADVWRDRGFGVRMLENALRLASPVL